MSCSASTGEVGDTIAAAEVVSKAIKASGAIVQVEPRDFLALLLDREPALAIVSATKFLRAYMYEYLTSHRGFIFYTKSKTPLQLPSHTDRISAKKIWIPG